MVMIFSLTYYLASLINLLETAEFLVTSFGEKVHSLSMQFW